MKRIIAVAAFACLAIGGRAQAECRIDTLSELPVTMRNSSPLIAVKVNGEPEHLIVDSGSAMNMLTPAGAAKAHMKLSSGPGDLTIFGVGGSAPVKIGTAARFEMGNVPIPDLDFLVAGPLADGADGLLGQSVLRVVDVEYDLAHGVIRLMKPKGCEKAQLAYWAKDQGVGVIPLELQDGGNPFAVGTGHVNGARIRVMLDTGAGESFLSQRGAAAAGVRLDAPGVQRSGRVVGLDQRPMQSWIAPVDSFEVGGEQIKHTRLRIGGLGAVAGIDEPDMLLGADFFLSHRVYVSNSQHKVYFTYSGGPVFDLSQKSEPSEPAKAGGG